MCDECGLETDELFEPFDSTISLCEYCFDAYYSHINDDTDDD